MSEYPQELTDRKSLVRAYYDALDSHDYDRLETLLAPDFIQERPDMRLTGRDEFIEFMREKRPMTDTTHPIETVYTADGGNVAVRGRLIAETGEVITGFVDCFELEEGRIRKIETYTD